MSKVSELKLWFNSLKMNGIDYIMTSEVNEWGGRNYYNRALRTTQELASIGESVRRLSRDEQKMSGYNTRQGVYEIL